MVSGQLLIMHKQFIRELLVLRLSKIRFSKVRHFRTPGTSVRRRLQPALMGIRFGGGTILCCGPWQRAEKIFVSVSSIFTAMHTQESNYV